MGSVCFFSPTAALTRPLYPLTPAPRYLSSGLGLSRLQVSRFLFSPHNRPLRSVSPALRRSASQAVSRLPLHGRHRCPRLPSSHAAVATRDPGGGRRTARTPTEEAVFEVAHLCYGSRSGCNRGRDCCSDSSPRGVGRACSTSPSPPGCSPAPAAKPPPQPWRRQQRYRRPLAVLEHGQRHLRLRVHSSSLHYKLTGVGTNKMIFGLG